MELREVLLRVLFRCMVILALAIPYRLNECSTTYIKLVRKVHLKPILATQSFISPHTLNSVLDSPND
jgi:hypothetical protein